MYSKEELLEAVVKMTSALAKVSYGTEISTARLFENCGYDLGETDVDSLKWLDEKLREAAADKKIILGPTAFDGTLMGMPFYIPFMVKNRSVEELKRELCSIEYTVISFSTASSARLRFAKAMDREMERVTVLLEQTGGSGWEYPERQISAAAWEELAERILNKARVQDWEKDYVRPRTEMAAMSGETWQLCLTLKDGTGICFSGEDAYPDSFGELKLAFQPYMYQ